MSHQTEARRLQEELIAHLSIPEGSKIPDPSTGLSTPAEYDRYFGLCRDNPGLVDWSRMCVAIYEAQLDDLNTTTLKPEEKCEILKGIVLVQRLTIEKWIKAVEAAQDRP
jgi:hypothetical protein